MTAKPTIVAAKLPAALVNAIDAEIARRNEDMSRVFTATRSEILREAVAEKFTQPLQRVATGRAA